ncbi:MAG: hypothetical protein ACYC41_12775 [Bacillota bacterium]
MWDLFVHYEDLARLKERFKGLPEAYLDSLGKAMLEHLSAAPLDVDQLSRAAKVEINQPQFRQCLAGLVEHGLACSTESSFRSLIPILDSRHEARARAAVEPWAANLSRAMAFHIAAAGSTMRDSGRWEELAPYMVSVLVWDWGVPLYLRRRLAARGNLRPSESGSAFGVSHDVRSALRVSVFMANSDYTLLAVWFRRTNLLEILDKAEVRACLARLEEALGLPLGSRGIPLLADAGLAAKTGRGDYRLNVPLVRWTDIEPALPHLSEASMVASEMLAAKAEFLLTDCGLDGYGQSGVLDCIEMVLPILSRLSTEILVGLPNPPNRRQPGCGVVAWQGMERAEAAMCEKQSCDPAS